MLPGQALESGEPAPVIAPLVAEIVAGLPRRDVGDQVLPEVLPVDTARIRQRDYETERLALPRRGEHQLAVVTRRCRGPGGIEQVCGVRATALTGHGALTLATPTIESLVTRVARSSSDKCSVPAGRSGSTMYLTSELESKTRMSVPSASSRPSWASTLRGSRTMPDR